MKNSVYLGDIDPNNNLLSAMNIRRILMFQLLIWDKIILSDSQFLTDPRLNILMSGYSNETVCKKYQMDDVSEQHKGIEALFENGLIEVALRKSKAEENSLKNTWNGMRKGEKQVPFLPEDERYVDYLQSISCNHHFFETSQLAAMFQDRLNIGLEEDPKEGGIVLQNTDTETELKRLFRERNPLFRNLLDFLRGQMQKGELSRERYLALYDYIYGCYNVNVSAALKCSINTKFAHIPFHTSSGEEYYGDNFSSDQIDRMRPTWALNPAFFDYVTFEEFAEIRSDLSESISKIREFYLGKKKSDWTEIEGAWDHYTKNLEKQLKYILLEKKSEIDDHYINEFVDNKAITKPRQYTLTTPILEISKSIVSFIPGISEYLGAVDAAKGIFGAVVTLSRRKTKLTLSKERDELSSLVSKETRVVTKYEPPSDTKK